MPLPSTTPHGGRLRGARDLVAERDAFRGGVREGFRRRVRRHDPLAQRGGTAGRLRERREHGEIDRAALGMQIEQALRELGHLADAAGDGHPRHRMLAQIFEHAADEVAHVDERDLRQIVQLLHRRLGGVCRSSRRPAVRPAARATSMPL